MKKTKLKVTAFLSFLILFYSIQPALAVNQYSAKTGAQFRWDASKYIFIKDGLGLGSDLSDTHSYYLEFDFTNWAEISGVEYLNGTINNNGTIYVGEISHATYYFGTPTQSWVTEIIDIPGLYPIHVHLICDTEIVQTTKPDLQNLAANSPDFTFGESSANNCTLTGTYMDGSTYTGNIEFNSDKVLKYVYDELVLKSSGDTMRIDRYIWTLTYTPGTGAGSGNASSIPGFQLIFIIGAMTVGFIFILKKHKLSKTR